jgi:hypothetical protein
VGRGQDQRREDGLTLLSGNWTDEEPLQYTLYPLLRERPAQPLLSEDVKGT